MKKYCMGAIALALLVSGIRPVDSKAGQTRISITPLVILSAQHDSNFFKTPTDEQDIITIMTRPGIEAEVETERSYLSLYYTLDPYFYENADSDLDFTGHTFKFDTGTESRSKRFKMRLKDYYNRSRNPDYNDYLTNSVSRSLYGINRLRPEVEYLVGNALLSLAYGNVQIKYDKDELLINEDSSENWGIGEIRYNLDMRNVVGVQAQYWAVDYDKATTDYDAWQAMAFFSRKGKYFTLDGGVGWQSRSFDTQPAGGGVGIFQPGALDKFVWKVGLDGSKGGSRFSIRADNNLNVVGNDNEYYLTTKLAIDLAHTFDNTKLTTGLKGRLQNSDYEYTDREDDTWGLEGRLEYPFVDWLTGTCAAGYENRNSNVAINEYENYYGLLQLQFVYPLGTGSPKITPYNK